MHTCISSLNCAKMKGRVCIFAYSNSSYYWELPSKKIQRRDSNLTILPIFKTFLVGSFKRIQPPTPMSSRVLCITYTYLYIHMMLCYYVYVMYMFVAAGNSIFNLEVLWGLVFFMYTWWNIWYLHKLYTISIGHLL